MADLGTIEPALITGGIGILVALITALAGQMLIRKQFDFRIKELERQTRTESIKKYLNPLQVATKDIKDYLSNMLETFNHPEQIERLKSDFRRIKDADRNNKSDFANWCNDQGHEAVAGLYSTAVYFFYASRIRSELPFIELQPGDGQKLFDHLSKVRESFGGTYGIWPVLQDSIGSYVRRADGSVFNYREFCTEIIDSDKRSWYLRLIDFYREFYLKKGDIEEIRKSLDELISFLDTKGLSSLS